MRSGFAHGRSLIISYGEVGPDEWVWVKETGASFHGVLGAFNVAELQLIWLFVVQCSQHWSKKIPSTAQAPIALTSNICLDRINNPRYYTVKHLVRNSLVHNAQDGVPLRNNGNDISAILSPRQAISHTHLKTQSQAMIHTHRSKIGYLLPNVMCC